MVGSTILGYASRAIGEPLKPLYYAAPELGVNDVRIAITHCGLCHSDIHAVDDYYGITSFPFVPGHEIAGYVSQVGEAVSSLTIGDRVGVGWQGRSCGHCEWCLKGEEQLCFDIVDSGTWVPYGGFSSSVVVDHRFAHLLPEEMPSEVAAVLLCAGITVYYPLRAFAEQPGKKIAIVGVGGLGHLAIQFARAFNFDVTVISSSVEKQEQALTFGADNFILSSDLGVLRENNLTFDMVLCTATDSLPWERLLMTLKKGGRFILVSFLDITLNTTELVARNLSISGSFLGNRASMREMLVFAQEQRITPVIELMPMAAVNEAMQRVRENKARYRIVLVNEV